MSTTLDRPQALTPDVQEQILLFVSRGSYFAPACRAAGVTRQTVEYWRKLYEAGAEHAQTYADFFAALEKAQALAEVTAVAEIASGANGWQSRAWFLERKFPKRWAAKQKIAAVHSGSIAMTHEQALAELDGPDDADGPTQATPAPG